MDHREFSKRANPECGDVLISKDGATLGVPRVIETTREFSIFVSVALIKIRRDLIEPYFLQYVLEAEPVQEQFRMTRAGAALPHIHLVDLRRARLGLPTYK